MRRFADQFRRFMHRYGHGTWIVAYFAFYLVGFAIVENAGHRHYHIIHSVIDDMIPFCEYFIVPYYLWFAYIAAGILFFIFWNTDKTEYDKLCCSLAIGMTLFLIVSCVYPNAQDLRPTVFARNNIFVDVVKSLYRTDTPTNILPSIHVYNSLVMFYALNSCRMLQDKKWVRGGALVLTILIIASTMFLKQHSVVDVSMGILSSFAVQMGCDRLFDTDRETARVHNTQ